MITRRAKVLTACGAAVVLIYSAAVDPENLPSWIVCPFSRLTGLPCPGCGLSHAFCAISHGQFQAAYCFNPWAFLFYALALTFVAWPLSAHYAPYLEHRVLRTRVLTWGPPVLVAAMWCFGLYRIFRLSH